MWGSGEVRTDLVSEFGTCLGLGPLVRRYIGGLLGREHTNGNGCASEQGDEADPKSRLPSSPPRASHRLDRYLENSTPVPRIGCLSKLYCPLIASRQTVNDDR